MITVIIPTLNEQTKISQVVRLVKKAPEVTEILENNSFIRDQMDFAIKVSVLGLKEMLIFDMDNTILHYSFISTLADKFNFKGKHISIIVK